MVIYVPGTEETDPKKQNMSLQQIGGATSTNQTNIATNTTNIATLTTNAATYVVGPASATANGFAVYNGITGKLVKDHAATIALASEVSGTLPVANGGTNYTGGAWSTYTPTITPTGGTFTSATASGSFLVIGKLVHFTVTITITTVGTATGKINLPLPTGTAVRNFAAIVADNGFTGKSGNYVVAAGASTGTIAAYDNATTFLNNGASLYVTGIYEQT